MASLRKRPLWFATLLVLGVAGCKSIAPDKSFVSEENTATEPRPVRLPDVAERKSDTYDGQVVQAAYQEPAPLPPDLDAVELLPTQPPVPPDRFPIDLPTALELAGANNLQIAFARQQTAEAIANVRAADVMWVPNLRAGVVYNNHSGRIQATEGDVLEVSRSSLFVGAGAVTDQAPTAGGSGGPARMFVDLPLVEVLLEPLAARQARNARQSHHAATFNDELLATSRAYLQLQQAESQLAIASETIENATRLANLTSEFASAGEGLQADAKRAEVELANRRRELSAVAEQVGVSSTELARLLRLDQSTVLFPAEQHPFPLELIPAEMSLPGLIQQAVASRPEVNREACRVAESWTRQRKECLRPWTPNIFAGFSGGGFGGSPGSSIDSFNDRADFDVGAIWEWQNLGMGNRAQQRVAGSRYQQARILSMQVRDVIASEVAAAYRQVAARRAQLEPARDQVEAAWRALKLNFEGIRGAVVRPIEAQQAISALAKSRSDYLDAVTGYNEAQLGLIRAIGQPPSLNPALNG